jgi:hypothetical protein
MVMPKEHIYNILVSLDIYTICIANRKSILVTCLHYNHLPVNKRKAKVCGIVNLQ